MLQSRGVLTAHAWWLCQCETGACQYHWCSIYRGLERVGSWVPGGSVGRDQLAMAAKVRRHWFNPCRLGSRGHLGANFSLLLYTDHIKKRKPSRYSVVSLTTRVLAPDCYLHWPWALWNDVMVKGGVSMDTPTLIKSDARCRIFTHQALHEQN